MNNVITIRKASEKDIENVTILEPPVDTSSIIKKSNLVIGAGGTMNREAAILQTPVISCYPGKTLSVDQYYIDKGLMYRSIETEDIISQALSSIANPKEEVNIDHDDLFKLVVDKIYELGSNNR